ncbi:Putative ABC transporter [Acididesulfobacillus acetoxydans]|uniref:ABC transporter n=1 Tax=Acididesulfobacillus acetoxydans TaxID=1561005 RepID=A0A8S0Y1X5_9FIRM|nr:heme ABC exporter ATP-binding protein CcmA [Acididesulfobacillus acetoxydans]CAA7600065.1 Putative ABC transporter [Acididesulfobacillus acetoxydans]CEJ07840.1 ATPases associated with a variety of cellular activities [Acididesulfobacillus acetoxydans]
MLQIVEVRKSYGSLVAVRDVSLEIPSGEVWALCGPNGAGKTTLLKMMAGLIPPDEGSLNWGAYGPRGDVGVFKKSVHYVPQKVALYPNLTVGETLRFFAKLRDADNLQGVLERFALLDLQNRLLRTLSGGQKQRVAVAQAFLGGGEYLLLDEPTVNLDREQADGLKEALRGFADKGGTVIISTHIADDLVSGFVNHRVLMERGSVASVS